MNLTPVTLQSCSPCPLGCWECWPVCGGSWHLPVISPLSTGCWWKVLYTVVLLNICISCQDCIFSSKSSSLSPSQLSSTNTSSWLGGVRLSQIFPALLRQIFPGLPCLNMLVWVVLRLLHHHNTTSPTTIHVCPFFAKTDLDYVYEVPSCLILLANTFFLIWIVVVCEACYNYLTKYLKNLKYKVF